MNGGLNRAASQKVEGRGEIKAKGGIARVQKNE